MKKTITLLTILLFVVFMVGCENSLNPTQPNNNQDISLAKQSNQDEAVSTLAKGGADKVEICHRKGNGDFITISVAASAVPAHLDHGDFLPWDISGEWTWVGWDWKEIWHDWDWTGGPPSVLWTTSHTWVITQNGTSIFGTGQHSGGLTWTFTGTIIGKTISLDGVFDTAVLYNFHLDGTIQSDNSIRGLFYYNDDTIPNPHPFNLPWMTTAGAAFYNSCE